MKVLLLDLESTLIPVWTDFTPIPENIEKIKTYANKFQPDLVGLFSWAMWDQRDVEIWERNKHWCEDALGFNITQSNTILDFISAIKMHCGPSHMDNMDFFDFYNKETCLFNLMLNGWNEFNEVVLFDDAVKPCEVYFERTSSSLKIINICDL